MHKKKRDEIWPPGKEKKMEMGADRHFSLPNKIATRNTW